MANYDLISIGSNEQDLMLKMVDIKSLDDLFDAFHASPVLACAGYLLHPPGFLDF